MPTLDLVTELSVLYEISSIPARLIDFHQISELAVDKAVRLLGNDVTIFYLYNQVTATFHPQAARGVRLLRLTKLPLTSIGQAVKQTIAAKRPLALEYGKVTDAPDLLGSPYIVKSAIYAPVQAGDELLGLIYAARLKDRPFNLSEQSLFGVLAKRVASAIENARLLNRLRLSEGKYRLVVENANEAIIIVQDGMLKFFNPKAMEITGYSQFELASKPLVELIYPDDREMVVEQHLRKLEDKSLPHTNSFRVIDKGGNIKWLAINTVLIAWEGKPATLHFLSDITERKNLEEQLLQSHKMEVVGRLAGGIAHDFNNLLTVIIGYCDILLDSLNQDDPKRTDLEEIKKAGERATSLISQLLAFSRKQVLQQQVFDFNALISNMKEILRRLIGENIELVTVLDPQLGCIKADSVQIEQVIMNLTINARDAMPKGGRLTIETANIDLGKEYSRRHIEISPGPYVMLAVTDTGIGMDKKTKSHIFEPFFTTKERGKGIGLGLATVYGIVKQSGGHIWFYSESGQGTTFKIYLPRIEEAVKLGKPNQAPTEPVRGTETVLLVEDEDVVREFAYRSLRNYGYNVLEAHRPEEAFQICQHYNEGPIHLLLTDVVMPGISGRELAERLTSLRPEMKILYMSGYTDNAIVHHGILNSGVAFLQKPFTSDILACKVREVLDASRGGKQ